MNHRKITLPNNGRVNTVGKFLSKIRLNGGINADVPFWVVPEGTEDVEAEKAKVEAAQQADAERSARLEAEAAEMLAQQKAADKAKKAAEAAGEPAPADSL